MAERELGKLMELGQRRQALSASLTQLPRVLPAGSQGSSRPLCARGRSPGRPFAVGISPEGPYSLPSQRAPVLSAGPPPPAPASLSSAFQHSTYHHLPCRLLVHFVYSPFLPQETVRPRRQEFVSVLFTVSPVAGIASGMLEGLTLC